jgi:hypothetical protein
MLGNCYSCLKNDRYSACKQLNDYVAMSRFKAGAGIADLVTGRAKDIVRGLINCYNDSQN